MEDKSRYYAIAPRAVELLLEHEHFTSKIWDCGCGEEFIPKILGAHGYEVITGPCPNDVLLGVDMNAFSGDVIANPPILTGVRVLPESIERGAGEEQSRAVSQADIPRGARAQRAAQSRAAENGVRVPITGALRQDRGVQNHRRANLRRSGVVRLD